MVDDLQDPMYAELKMIAHNQEKITYKDFAGKFKLHYLIDRPRLCIIYDAIDEKEHQAEKPMITAVIIRAKTNTSGNGFYKCADRLGLFKYNYDDEKSVAEESRKASFHKRHLAKVHDYWLKHSRLSA